MLKKLFSFLFKSKPSQEKAAAPSNDSRKTGNQETSRAESRPVSEYGIIARNRNHKGLRKGSKVYLRQIFEDGERLRVRGTAPNGKKVSLTINRRALKQYESEGVPEHLVRHYKAHSLFPEEHEAKMKAEALNKRT